MRIQLVKIRILFLVFLLSAILTKAQNTNIEFREISPKGGFTFGAITQVIEDENGFIWFSSQHGLFRYNSQTIDKFVHIPSDPNSILSNFINWMDIDNNGTLWFATDQGICFFNNEKENFEKCTFTSSEGEEKLPDNILQLFCDKTGKLWLIDGTSLFEADPQKQKFRKVVINDNNNNNNPVNFGYCDKQQQLWLQCGGTVLKASFPYNSFSKFGNVNNKSVHTMLFAQNKLWIGYEWNGADCYDLSGNFIAHYGNNVPEQFNIGSTRVRKIFEDKEGNIWFGTYNGLSILKNGQIKQYTPENTKGLLHPSIYDIFIDHNQGIWVSTWAGNLSYLNPHSNSFQHITKKDGLSDNVVSSFAESQGILWIGTEAGGLNSFVPETGKILNHSISYQNTKVRNVKSLLADKQNSLWVGTFNEGLWLMPNANQNNGTKNFTRILNGGFYDLAIDENQLWAASFFQGVYKINLQTKSVENFTSSGADSTTISSNQVRTLLVDHSGNLWVGTQTGLNFKRKNEIAFTRFLSNERNGSISSNQIYTLFEDSGNTLWIGTATGLNKYLPTTNSFEAITPEQGLAGYEVYGILEDTAHKLWISTDNGISEYNPKTGEIRNFYASDGLQGNQFNPGAAFKTLHGEMLFGGPNGISFFHPQKIRINPIAPKAIIHAISINNQLVKPGDKTSILGQSICTSEEIKLKYDQNSLTFYIVANNYLNPEKNKFSYILENYDEDWISSHNGGLATYTKIPPGSYTFKVKASNNDGVWVEKPTELTIHISHPWWQRWYTYTIYLILFIGITFVIQREILIRQKLRHEMLMEKIKSTSEKELNQAKLTFFTNISHEIRTPLSLILSPIDYIIEKRKNDRELAEQLKTIQRNGNRLKYLLHQVIDIRKIEAGKLSFRPVGCDLVPLIEQVISCFSLEAIEREINLQFKHETLSALVTELDPEKIDKIVFNLVSNAFKFTPFKGRIDIELKIENRQKPFIVGEPIQGEYLEFSVCNSGSIIPADEYSSVFERFFQGKENRKKGTGIGLHMVSEYTKIHGGNIDLNSTETTGTCFSVRIPMKSYAINETTTTPYSDYLYEKEEAPAERLIDKTEGNSKLILIVEDNAELRTFLRKSLSNWYTIITASNGKMGVEMANEMNPDLIISDVMMPEMNGFELCKTIKNDVNTSHIPIILLTALTAVEKQIEGISTGADAYISKPFSEKLLRTQIENLLLSRQKLRELFLDPEANLAEKGVLPNDFSIIESAIQIVETHLLDPNFTVEMLADELRISRSSLHRKLKVHTDQSSTEFIRYVRLKKALKLLKAGNLSIDEISYAVGFNSPSYFSQSFKKQFGKSPKEYLQGKS